MNFFSNLSTRAKLAIGFALIVALLAAVSAAAYRYVDRLKENQALLFHEDLGLALDFMKLRNALNRERAALQGLVLGGTADTPVLLQELERDSAEIAGLGKRLAAVNASPELEALLQGMRRARLAFEEVRDGQALPALRAGQREQATAIIQGPLRDHFYAFRRAADEAGELQLANAQRRMRESEALVERFGPVLIVANLLAILIGLALVFGMDRHIALPLRRATGVAKQIAGGDLTAEIPTTSGKDEVAQLLASLNSMVLAWREVLSETHAGIATLSDTASGISGATTQTAAGASQTAAAVSETTTTVEEVKQTALLSSQKARALADAAQQANRAASDGMRAIEQSITGMESIDQQMESIAGTIVRLSEQSHAVGEIVATVGGLAEQSNLLAVNAAIEAAKAGEHGKGFGVVAQEVRSLAEQSKQATRQVRVILNDIQKAISAAVMTTEQGARTVASGVEQTGQAEQAIKALSESVASATEAASQIAASSQQQLAGMDQVAVAMEQIKQVTAENAASARESELAARKLQELGRRLASATERFRL